MTNHNRLFFCDLSATRRHAIHLTPLVHRRCMRKFDKFKLFNNLTVSPCHLAFSSFFFILFNFVQMAEFSTPTTPVKCKSKVNNGELRTPVKASASPIQIPASRFLEKIGYGTGMFIFQVYYFFRFIRSLFITL